VHAVSVVIKKWGVNHASAKSAIAARASKLCKLLLLGEGRYSISHELRWRQTQPCSSPASPPTFQPPQPTAAPCESEEASTSVVSWK
jgi:hypothetical protein